MKKVVSLLVVFCMLMPLLPTYTLAEDLGINWDIVADYDDAYPYQAVADLSSDASCFQVAASAQQWTDDLNRILRKQGYALDAPLYLTYYLEAGIGYFEVMAGAIENTPGAAIPKAAFETSPDGTTWTKLPDDAVSYVETGKSQNWHASTCTPSRALPDGTKYIRMHFGAGATYSQFQITKASFSSENSFGHLMELQGAIDAAQSLMESIPASMVSKAEFEAFSAAIESAREVLASGNIGAIAGAIADLAAASEAFKEAVESAEGQVTPVVDPCADLSMVHRTIGNVAVTTNNPQLYDGDADRFHKPDAHKDVSIVYSAGQKFYDYIQVESWYLNYSGKVCQNDFTIEASPDDVAYKPVTAQREANIDMAGWSSGTWRKYLYRVDDLPTGTKYLKINFPDTTQSGQVYTVQIVEVEFGVKDNFRYGITSYIDRAEEILGDMNIGPDCTQEQYDALHNTVEAAKEALDTAAIDQLQPVFEGLVTAYEKFIREISFRLQWPEGAAIEASAVTGDSITINWPEIPGAVYSVYQGDKLAATTHETTYTAAGLVEGATYQFRVVAEKYGAFTAELAPASVTTEGGFLFPVPDFTDISPDDFDDMDYLAPLVRYNDTRTIPYYYYHLHTVLNGIVMSGPDKGFVDVHIARNQKDNKPYNARIQEAYLPITYFYSRNEDWNVYYNDPNVKERLEAVIEHALKLQRADGPLSEYSATNYSLAPTTFFLEFVTQVVRLLKDEENRNPDFQSIDPALMTRLEDSIRRAIIFILTNKGMYDFGINFSNQYGLIWSATMAYLEYRPEDTEIIELFREKYPLTENFISPAGFYYENGGFDMGYNLGVHVNTIVAEYDYLKGTEYEETFLEHQGKFIDWLSYNLVMEPDGSMFVANGAASNRTDSSGISFVRKNFPVAEKIEVARAFSRTDMEIEEEIERNKAALTENGAWPNVPEMVLKGGDTYEVSMFFDKLFPTYAPTEQERQAAIQKLPYIANNKFTQFRKDPKSGSGFSFVRKPSYYTAFNSGTKRGNMTVFGMGLLWHPEGGTMISSVSENTDTTFDDAPISNDLSWGTRKYYEGKNQKSQRVYEAKGAVTPTSIKIDGQKVAMADGITDMPDGELEINYVMGSGALDKTVTYREEDMQVDILHPGRFQECFPLMVRPEDKFEVHSNQFTLVRGRTVMDIKFSKDVQIDVTKSSRTNQRFQMYLMEATTADDLSYTITMYTRDPELLDNPSNVQVSIDDIVTGEMPELPAGGSEAGEPAGGSETQKPTVPGSDADVFSDISGHWARDDINYLARNGYIAERDDGLFQPDREITRAEFVEMVIRAFGITLDTSKEYQNFSDVATDVSYYEPVTAAKQKGIVRGVSSDQFLPNDVIATQEMELIVLRAYQYVTGAENISGNATATRGQAAAVLKRLLDDVDAAT